jgi:hypothetical protein
MKGWRLWTKILLGLSIVAVVASGITAGVLYGTHTWVRNGCFTVNYVDLRGGYAPAGVYTTIGEIDDYANDNIYMGDIGKWKAGDSYCGPITYGVEQRGGIVFFGPTVNTTHAVPQDPFGPTNVGYAP